MSDRITIKTLRALCNTLNRMTGSPTVAYVKHSNGELRAQVGHYFIDCAYSGYQLARMDSTSGGQSSPLGLGYHSARDTYDKIRAYMAGIEQGKEWQSKAMKQTEAAQ